MAYLPNSGRLPPECEIRDETGQVVIGYRAVFVRLRCGIDTRKRGDPPWPAAGGNPPTRWGIESHPYDILEFEIA